jgi:FAD/FMN-containing dehydrogenase
MTLSPDHLSALGALTGPKGVITGDDTAPYLTEWRKRWQGETPLILAPATREEAAEIVRYCHEHDIGITPQGGNTGLVGGQVPNGTVLITMKRLRRIREISTQNNTLTIEAGATLAEAQQAAEEANRLLPLSIGSEGTCQIGGIISTNAGGVNVIRYGNTRDLVLGLEAILPNGDIWHGLNALRKNNTGYDLKQLFIGAEGTLGLVTAATLKLFPRPGEIVTAFASVPSPQAAVDLLGFMQEATGGQATSFELMSRFMLDLVVKNVPDMKMPLAGTAPWYVLMEFSAGQQSGLGEIVEQRLGEALDKNFLTDATLATSKAQANALWALRHNASEAMHKEPAYCVKCDVSVPIHKIPAFLEEASAAVLKNTANSRIVAFGHMGDGNIHYDILAPEAAEYEASKANGPAIEKAVHDIVITHDGSISAEHGIGLAKRDELKTRKSPVEMAMMQSIKQALDPKGIMNPGKLL